MAQVTPQKQRSTFYVLLLVFGVALVTQTCWSPQQAMAEEETKNVVSSVFNFNTILISVVGLLIAIVGYFITRTLDKLDKTTEANTKATTKLTVQVARLEERDLLVDTLVKRLDNLEEKVQRNREGFAPDRERLKLLEQENAFLKDRIGSLEAKTHG